MQYTIRQPKLLKIKGDRRTYWGASQQWYTTYWQREAGCGPTNCATLLWYLAQTRPGCEGLAAKNSYTKKGFTALMQAVWRYVTPGLMGLHRTSHFCRGATAYATAHHVPLVCKALNLKKRNKATQLGEATAFLSHALANDLPVAFLNLAREDYENMDSWHWTTIIGFDDETKRATMLDGGAQKDVDFGGWLLHSKGRGGLVTLQPADESPLPLPKSL